MTLVKTVVLMQPCTPLNWGFKPTRFKVQSCSSLRGNTILPALAASPWSEVAVYVLQHFTADSPFQRESQGTDGILPSTRKESPSAGPPLVIGSLCTAPPGRYDSPCRGRGAGIWRWSRRSWTAADPAAGHIQHALPRRRGRGGSPRTPVPHTGSPAWKQRQDGTNLFQV